MKRLRQLRKWLRRRTRRRDRAIASYKATGKDGLKVRRQQRVILKLRSLIRAYTNPHGITSKGARFIATFEGFCPVPVDIGDGVTTVGIGHVIHSGPPTAADRSGIWIKGQKTPGQMTYSEAVRLLQRDLADTYEPPVRKLFERGGPLFGKYTPWRLDALVSVAYNLGVGAVLPYPHTGFETLGSALKAGSIRGIADALPLYRNPGSIFEEGLLRRRNAEARLLLTGNYKIN